MQIPEVLEALETTQAKLAERLGVTRGAVAQWNKSGVIPRVRQLQIEAMTSGRLKAGPECDEYRVPHVVEAA